MITFEASLNFDLVKEIRKYDVTYFNEESENTYDNEVFCSTILRYRKKLNIFMSQLQY